MGGLVKAKYEGEEKERKAELLKKLSFDAVFYLSTSVYCYF